MKLQTSLFFFKRRARSFVPFARICAFVFARVHNAGSPWGDDLNVVLFEFLDDDTKLAQSCTDWLYVQHWYTVVPEPSMRATLWALMGVGDDCDKRTQDTSPHFFFFSCRSDLRQLRVYKRTAQCLKSSSRAVVHICITRRPLSQGQACVDGTLFVVSVGTPGRLSLHRATVHIRRGLRCWQGRFLHLFWYCRSFVSAVRYFVSIHTCRSCHFQS